MKLNRLTPLMEFATENTLKFKDYKDEFQDTFNRPLKKFFDLIYGFDAVGFDEWIAPADGTSTYQEIERRYGAKAVELIKNLL